MKVYRNTQVVDVDITGYFDAIPHDRLLALVREHIADGRVLGLIEGFLKQGVIEGMDWAGSERGRHAARRRDKVRCWPTFTSIRWTG